jgi:SHOCT-like domain
MFTTASDDRTTILRMIEERKITADEGAKLLAALGKPAEPKAALQPAAEGGKGRFFKVLVTDTATGRAKTSVTIPMGLVRWGLKVGAHYSHDMEGIDMDELADLLDSGTVGQIVDVVDEEDGEHVQIFVE